MDTMINLIVKVQQFEDKRIEAKASWNIKELKGKLSEIYPTSTEEQKLIYSGKLLNDTVVLKDVLREYEGQEAHTVHLVFTPKTSSRLQSKLKESTQTNSSATNQSSTSDMSTSELRQRNTAANATTQNSSQEQTQQSNTNIPSNYYNAFYGNNMPYDANSLLAQQYAMQTWMQQAYAQYMNQYMNLVQQQQPAQQASGFPFMQPQMPFFPPTITPTSSAPPTSTVQSPNPETQASPAPQEPQQPQVEPPAAEPQRRFPNIIQDEQENRDWLDIIYSMSRLLILLCLVYFYSSPLRCIIVILIGLSIYLYHIYRQNQNRLNNNNTTRVNLNVNRPPQPPAGAAAADARPENVERTENSETSENNQQQDGQTEGSETEPLVNASENSQSNEPQVSWLTIARTFVVSFVASIIPEHPAM